MSLVLSISRLLKGVEIGCWHFAQSGIIFNALTAIDISSGFQQFQLSLFQFSPNPYVSFFLFEINSPLFTLFEISPIQ
jgi:hypothetical protein